MLTSDEEQRTCFICDYFQMKQWDIGYCRLHQVNVLQSYSCSKFVLREKEAEADEQEIDAE